MQRMPVVMTFPNSWIVLQNGWISSTLFPHEPPLLAIKCDGCGIHHPITGMLLCPIQYDCDDEEWVLPSSGSGIKLVLTIGMGRVRNKLCGVDPEYDYTIDICVKCFYHGFKGSTNDPENGFLQSSLLIKVRTTYLYNISVQDEN